MTIARRVPVGTVHKLTHSSLVICLMGQQHVWRASKICSTTAQMALCNNLCNNSNKEMEFGSLDGGEDGEHNGTGFEEIFKNLRCKAHLF